MKIGFIGGGNMGSAIIDGLIASGYNIGDINVCELNEAKRQEFLAKGLNVTDSAVRLEDMSDIVVFSVKPNVIDFVLKQMMGSVDKIYISIAAGVSIAHLEDILGSDKKIVRTMPNTPAQVGCGMTVVTPNDNMSDEDTKKVLNVLSAIGETEILPEKFMNIATALHGSSPAYVYMMIDAMADAGVAYGLTKDQAIKLAAKAVEGSAKMVLETGIHPEKLKDNVCSPGGTTIAAVCDLERNGFKATMQSAVDACVQRAEEMSK